MDHSLRDRLKARLASLRERFGADDPDVKELAKLVTEDEEGTAEAKADEAP